LRSPLRHENCFVSRDAMTVRPVWHRARYGRRLLKVSDPHSSYFWRVPLAGDSADVLRPTNSLILFCLSSTRMRPRSRSPLFFAQTWPSR